MSHPDRKRAKMTNEIAQRYARVERKTGETDIVVELTLPPLKQGTQIFVIETGIGFFDHMLHAFAKHSGSSLTLRCTGDLHVDDHHSVEDCALALGAAFKQALGSPRGIRRFAHAYAPLDEALARVVIDISGRAFCSFGGNVMFSREKIGELSTEMVSHFFESFASAAGITLHVDLLKGTNDHHKAESSFKAFAIAIREAIAIVGDQSSVPSTKGILEGY